jgi:tRNA 2-thiocytidine biosynthesis protein TtcA
VRAPALAAPSAQLRRSAGFAFTQAALQSVLHLSAVPAPLARAVAHGLREAIAAFDMVREGDRVLVGLSGGKDSMTLLVQLLRLQAVAPGAFEVAACTVDPQSSGYDPAPLRAWCASLGVRYFVEDETPIMALARAKMKKESLCAFCARLKRGLLYAAMRREGFNVLALGQHLDDLAESFLMSATRNGLLRTMKAHYAVDAGDLRVVRPLAFLRERTTRDFAHACRLPVIPENCPACFRPADERYRVKRMLAAEEAVNPQLFQCLLRAMRPLMTSGGARAVREGAGGAAGDEEDDEGDAGQCG